MPYRFNFIINEPGQPEVLQFSCKLDCVQCAAKTLRGLDCQRTVCIGTPYCYMHLKTNMRLTIADSKIPNAGKGLFAYDPKNPDGNEEVFKRGQVIVQYDGEMITNAELDSRYGDYTAPYGIQEKYGVLYTEDGACRRGAGTLANHKPASKANAKLSFGTKKKRFQLVAIKPIKNGQEIYVSYTSGRQSQADRRYEFKERTSARTVRTRR